MQEREIGGTTSGAKSPAKGFALITGASAGLGKSFAWQLAEKGYNLVLVARNAGPLEFLSEEISRACGVQCICLPADLSEPSAPKSIFNSLKEKGIQIDYLVNNAGVAGPNLLEEKDWSKHTAFYQLMMLSIAEMCQLFIPEMQARGSGYVINVASMAGRIPRAGGCNYGPSKAWVIALSEELSVTVRKSGVKVCALCPGFTHTEFHERAGLTAMKNAMPKWWWYDADLVVREGLNAVEKGKRVYFSGRLYRVLDPLFRSAIFRPLFLLSDGR